MGTREEITDLLLVMADLHALGLGDESRPEGSVRMPTRNLHLMERPISKVP